MPEWLLREEQYQPLSDKDTYIQKSILGLLKLLARIRAHTGEEAAKSSVSAVCRLVSTLLLVVLVAVSRSFAFVLVAGVFLLCALSLMEAAHILRVIRTGLAAALLTAVIVLPAVLWGHSQSLIIPAKVLLTVMAVNMLGQSAGWNSLTGALKVFRVPDLFIFVMDLTIKYLLLLGELALQMFYALRLRSVGRNKGKQTSVGGIAGTLFIKSKEMAEEMVAAMECRGFTGDYRIRSKYKLSVHDGVYLLLHLGLAVIFFYLREV